MKIGLIQMSSGPNKFHNINLACDNINKAIDLGAEFILLPEVFNYRGPLNRKQLTNFIAEDIPGESILPLMKIARDSRVNILAGSIYEKSNKSPKVYNTSVLINKDGKVAIKYRKINLFRAIVNGKDIDERRIFIPGDKPVTYKVNGIKVGLSICFDLRFPELYREYCKNNVNIILVPSSFTLKTGKLHWEVLLRARAIENYCYVLAPNQFGIDGNGIETYGHSMIIDPQGEIIGELNNQESGILIANLSDKYRSNFPIIN